MRVKLWNSHSLSRIVKAIRYLGSIFLLYFLQSIDMLVSSLLPPSLIYEPLTIKYLLSEVSPPAHLTLLHFSGKRLRWKTHMPRDLQSMTSELKVQTLQLTSSSKAPTIVPESCC